MKFCSECGSNQLRWTIPAGDNFPRYVCQACHTVHYQNPKVVTGCLASWENQVLLCKRAIEPRYGLWTLPAGFMEQEETLEQAALRETWEEAYARVEQVQLYHIFSLPHISQVYVMFRGQLADLDFKPGTESLAVQLFAESAIPWEEIAFRVVTSTLKQYFADYQTGEYPLQVKDIIVAKQDNK